MSEFVPSLETLPSLWYPLSIACLYLGFIIALAEAINRLTGTDAEFTRKIVHIGTGNVILLAWGLQLPAWIGIGAAVFASIVALISYFLPILPSINSIGRQSLGTFFYAVSIGVLVGWFWYLEQPQYAAIGILIMTWGDGMAALIGQNFGRHPYQVLGIQKSWEGSLTMFGVSFMVVSLIFAVTEGNFVNTTIIALLVAVVATGLEAFSKLGIDNLTVPIGSAALAYFLNQGLQ